MAETIDMQAAAQPSAELQSLSRLLGTWELSGGAQGQITYEWMEGGFFLLQRVNLNDNKGIEIIGHEKLFGSEPSAEIKSRFYGNLGDTLDYVYELEGETLTIWGGAKGSPAYYKGTFSDNDTVLSGDWVWPGGGYSSTATKVTK